ncbi:hypothetical protein J7M23_00640 [Candidatus Sumerlaeota bacterium]|nr:hypothetical protein [Candidatus Sumerlaeota bacterium]
MKKKFYIKLYHHTIAEDYEYNYDLVAEHIAGLGMDGVMTPVVLEHAQGQPGNESLKFDREHLIRLKTALKKRAIDFIPIVQFFQDAYCFEHHITSRPINNQGEIYPWTTDWYNPICPTERGFQLRRLELVKEVVRTLKPIAISLDFLRFPFFWEESFHITTINEVEEYCFCSRCLEQFQRAVPSFSAKESDTHNIAEHIYNTYADKWVEWKTRVIADYCQEVVNAVKSESPQTQTFFQLVAVDEMLPSPFTTEWLTGQNAQRLASIVDFLSPMLYHNVLEQKPEWVIRTVHNLAKKTEGTLLPTIQISDRFAGLSLKTEEIIRLIENLTLQPQVNGIAMFHFGALVDWLYHKVVLNEKYNALAQMLGSLR